MAKEKFLWHCEAFLPSEPSVEWIVSDQKNGVSQHVDMRPQILLCLAKAGVGHQTTDGSQEYQSVYDLKLLIKKKDLLSQFVISQPHVVRCW